MAGIPGIPLPGALYSSPPIPIDFAGMGVTPGILGTCYAVTSGPDRNLYWVYDDMKSTSTAIQVPVPRGSCSRLVTQLEYHNALLIYLNHAPPAIEGCNIT